jgi:hypothetical protein
MLQIGRSHRTQSRRCSSSTLTQSSRRPKPTQRRADLPLAFVLAQLRSDRFCCSCEVGQIGKLNSVSRVKQYSEKADSTQPASARVDRRHCRISGNSTLNREHWQTIHLPDWRALSGAVYFHEVTIATFEFQKLVKFGTLRLRNAFRRAVVLQVSEWVLLGSDLQTAREREITSGARSCGGRPRGNAVRGFLSRVSSGQTETEVDAVPKVMVVREGVGTVGGTNDRR